MAQTQLDAAKAAYDKGDIESLARLTDVVKRSNFADPESAKILNFLGELLRKNGRMGEAAAAYRLAHHPPDRTHPAALYGLAESYASRKDPRFARTVEALIKSGGIDARYASRLMVAAATMQDSKVLARLASLKFPAETLDAWYWVRRAKAAFHLGHTADVAAFAEKARAVGANDPDVLLAVAEVDYDAGSYWKKRYDSDVGKHAPLPPAYAGTESYDERTVQEIAYLEMTFDRAFGADHRFATGADCGCGSGRLTPFLHKRVKKLDCYDISGAALRYAKRERPGLFGLRYLEADLAVEKLPHAGYDLVFDFTVVQHQSDETKWKAQLANYAQATRQGGYIFLVELRGDDGPNTAPHVRNASAAAYERELKAGGCEIVLEEPAPGGSVCVIGRRKQS